MPLNYCGAKKSDGYQPPTSSKKEHEINFLYSEPKYTLDKLIISDKVRDEITTVITAKENWDRIFIDWDLQSVMGSRHSLFANLYGAPGTGKTMAAHAIAAALGKKILCVNYAEIESKYVGETSKNLTKLFLTAEHDDVIIFFDEADAFLSKRVSDMNNSTDVSVNQTRSVLLTLLNDYNGMVIFASNFISNYDAAFMRRIQYHIKFELPDMELRQKLWRMYIPERMPANIDFKDISEKFDNISGSDISNAVFKAALKAAKLHDNAIPQNYFEEAIKSIVSSKNANIGVKVETHMVTEEYALKQINGANKTEVKNNVD